MRHLIAVATGIALLATAGEAGAQGRWSIEASGGAAFATEKLGGADLGTGIGLEMNARYRFMPHLAIYGGWDWHHFPLDEPVGGDMDVEDTGYAFGLRFEHPLAGRVAGWLRFGGTANHLELENGDGDIISDSGHGLGWEAGAGLAVPVGSRVMLTPGARYRALSRDMEVGTVTTAADLRYVAVGMGIAYTF